MGWLNKKREGGCDKESLLLSLLLLLLCRRMVQYNIALMAFFLSASLA